MVKDWRHKLQKTFLSDNKDPKPEVRTVQFVLVNFSLTSV